MSFFREPKLAAKQVREGITLKENTPRQWRPCRLAAAGHIQGKNSIIISS